MKIRKLSDTFSVCGQIEPHDVPVIAAMGFKTILCNRPDGESEDQTLFEEIEEVAEDVGLAVDYLPIARDGPTASDIAQFKTLFAQRRKPILAYCRAGNRSQAIWSASTDTAEQ